MGPFTDSDALANAKELGYMAVVKKKLAANIQNFLSLISIPGFANVAQGKIQSKYAAGFGTIDKIPTVSDITVEAGFEDRADATKIQRVGSKEALDNEGYHRWDVSVGFPITRVEELQYDQTGNTIQTRQVDKASILALGDVYFRNVDIKNPGAKFTPALVFGMGLQGKVRERLFAGVSTNLGPIPGLSFTKSEWFQTFRPYVGVMFLNTQRTVANPAPGAPSIVDASTIKRLAAGSSSGSTTKSKSTAATGSSSSKSSGQ
jgi:hypothetical protein